MLQRILRLHSLKVLSCRVVSTIHQRTEASNPACKRSRAASLSGALTFVQLEASKCDFLLYKKTFTNKDCLSSAVCLLVCHL